MSKLQKKINRYRRGSVLFYSTVFLALMVVVATTFIDRTTLAYRKAKSNLADVQMSSLSEAGIQSQIKSIWIPFKNSQSFVADDTAFTGASPTNPLGATTGSIAGVGKYSVAVIGYVTPNNDSYSRQLKIRCVSWRDDNNNNLPDSNEPSQTIDTTYQLSLARSGVFDYTYFVNNFGWMTGFGQNDLLVNGDMRSNGDFTFTSGSGTVNGSIIASYNNKLTTTAAGVVNQSPYKLSDSAYEQERSSDPYGKRMRPSYAGSNLGSVGSSQFENYRDLVYNDTAQMDANRAFGSVIQDSSGTKSWTFNGSQIQTTALDTTASSNLEMPDLSSFGNVTDPASASGGQFAKSKAWTDVKATYLDGTSNPNYNGNSGAQAELNANGTPNVNYTGAYLDIWNSSTNAYQRVSSQGVVAASVLLAGTAAHPIRVHGPVAVNGDIAIAGNVIGQGTIYCARNAHVVGSIIYNNPPDFSGSDMAASDQLNEKKDMLGIAASQSVIMGDTTNFGFYPLTFMEPPFTQSRTDDNGNTVPAFNATSVDTWGVQEYQSLLQTGATAAAFKAMAAGGVNQIDAIMYTNFCGGGDVGTSGNGFVINGSIISRDEAMVTFSLPMRMNYDSRVRERSLNSHPLIDIDVPRSPTVTTMAWQDKGFHSQ